MGGERKLWIIYSTYRHSGETYGVPTLYTYILHAVSTTVPWIHILDRQIVAAKRV